VRNKDEVDETGRVEKCKPRYEPEPVALSLQGSKMNWNS